MSAHCCCQMYITTVSTLLLPGVHYNCQRTAVARCTLQLAEMCVFLMEFYLINNTCHLLKLYILSIRWMNKYGGWDGIERGKPKYRKNVPVTLCPPQMPHGLESNCGGSEEKFPVCCWSSDSKVKLVHFPVPQKSRYVVWNYKYFFSPKNSTLCYNLFQVS